MKYEVISREIVALGVLLSGMSAFSQSAKTIEVFPPEQLPFVLHRFFSDECKDMTVYEASFPFQDQNYSHLYQVMVFHEGFKTLQQTLQSLKSKGWTVAGLVNGGFFNPMTATPVSYFKSELNHLESPENSSRGPRACMVYHSSESQFELRQSTLENYAYFRLSKNTEIYCGGPQLLDQGKDVALEQYCREQFDPLCRPDHTDPGVNFLGSIPRTGSCFTADGEFKIFASISSAEKCGLKGASMAQLMRKEGCAFGMNHDGGGSAKFYLDDGKSPPVMELGYASDRARPVPVWIAVVKSEASVRVDRASDRFFWPDQQQGDNSERKGRK